MPVQRTCFGRVVTVPRRLPPRRILLVLFLVICFLLTTLLFATPAAPPTVSSPSSNADGEPNTPSSQSKGGFPLPKFSIPSAINPWKSSAHTPPLQSNSTRGDVKWLSDWSWLNPFSSSVTFDEHRSVLPPLAKRPYVYTFYESNAKQDDKARRDAEFQLLLTWRRAWWAQGFRPVVLGRADAMENPLYEAMRMRDLNKDLETDMARWLAWGQMGTGILSNWLAVPMAPYSDNLLSFLRHGKYPELTRFETLESGLFVGEKTSINAAIRQALNFNELKNAKSFIDAVPRATFKVDAESSSIAYYDAATITKLYSQVADKLLESTTAGLQLLPSLINSHLHQTFQYTFSNGISLLKPLPEHSTVLVEPASVIANLLIQCPDSPIPSSCPPNRQKCTPCISTHDLQILVPRVFRNKTALFTIGTVPHPYTRISLDAQRDKVDIKYIRRSTERDAWLSAATKEVNGAAVGSAPRIVRFKEMVAGEVGAASSLWLTPEKNRDPMEGLEWFFGFTLPMNKTNRGEARPPVPGSKLKAPWSGSDDDKPGATPDAKELLAEKSRLRKARDALKNKAHPMIIIKEAAEAWNIGDTEAWLFARAFTARRHVERERWEEEESKVTTAGLESRKSKNRWLDWRV